MCVVVTHGHMSDINIFLLLSNTFEINLFIYYYYYMFNTIGVASLLWLRRDFCQRWTAQNIISFLLLASG